MPTDVRCYSNSGQTRVRLDCPLLIAATTPRRMGPLYLGLKVSGCSANCCGAYYAASDRPLRDFPELLRSPFTVIY